MSFKLGLTGSIGMGKSTTARMFAEEGCAVWDADAAVHRLYSKGGAAIRPIEEQFPDAIVDGTVSRDVLRRVISSDNTALQKIEAIVHPLVAKDRTDFIAQSTADIVVFDIPLLFETGGESAMDAVAVVAVNDATQEKRVLARGTMTRDQFLAIRAKQMPTEEKCARADYVIETYDLDDARKSVQYVLSDIRNRMRHA